MATTTYKPNRAGIRAYLNSPDVYEAVSSVARDVKHTAEALAPVGETGDYKSSFQIDRAEVVIDGTPHATARVVNTSDHAAAVEWGYAGRSGAPGKSAHRTLGRALESAG